MANKFLIEYENNFYPMVQCGEFDPNITDIRSVTFSTNFKDDNVAVIANTFRNGSEIYNLYTISILSISRSGFTYSANFKDAQDDQAGGGPFTGKINYIAVQQYVELNNYFRSPLNNPYIACGKFDKHTGNSTNHEFYVPNPLGSADITIIFTAERRNGVNNITDMVTIMMYGLDNANIHCAAFVKDGRPNESGGGAYFGEIYYVAVHNSYSQILRTIQSPCIQTGRFEITQNQEGYFIVYFENVFPTQNVVVTANAMIINQIALVGVNFYSVTSSNFTGRALVKGAQNGSNAGGSFYGYVNYIAVCYL